MPKQLQRKCKCGACNNAWTDLQYVRKDGAYPMPECPHCSGAVSIREREGIKEILESGQAPAMGGRRVASRAGDLCGRMLEEDYGIPPSLINDNAREGDCYVKNMTNAPKGQYLATGESTKEITESFLAQARTGGGLGASGSLSGVDILEGAGKSGMLPNPIKHSEFFRTKD